MDVQLRQFNQSDKKTLTEMIFSLYREDPEGEPMTQEKINSTIRVLSEYPEKGRIVIIEKNSAIVGYSILVKRWSNEHGGDVLIVDELYITPSYRRKKIGTQFIRYLMEHKYSDMVGIEFEVMPSNRIARRFYEQCGLTLSDRNLFKYHCN